MTNSSPQYEAPEILETFEAFEIMGVGEGLEVFSVGCGSVTAVICLPS